MEANASKTEATKRRRFVIGALALGLAVAAVCFALPRQPAYEGRSLSAWLADFDLGRSRSHERAERAVRRIGTNGFATLANMLRTEDPAWKRALIKLNGKQSLLHFPVTPANSVRQRAVLGYAALGSEAKAHVPVLIQIFESDVSPQVRSSVASALGAIRPEAKAAVPALSKAIHDKNADVKQSALMALANIQMWGDVQRVR
jgi:hypothetical protein